MTEVIVVLSPGLPHPDGTFLNVERGVYIGGQVRMEAAAAYMAAHPEATMILTGGYNKAAEGDPTESRKVAAMAAFLVSRVAGAEDRIWQAPSLPCTRHNLVAVWNTLRRRQPDTTRIGVLTNSYHLPRALAFAALAAADAGADVEFYPIAAEDVLGRSIESTVGDQGEAYEARLALEQKGLEQLNAGTYTDSCLTAHSADLAQVIAQHAADLLTPAERADLQR